MKYNLNRQTFELSEISIEFLDKYLSRVKNYLKKNNGEMDLYEDIQERISEKFSDISGDITNKNVIDIVNEIWEPEEIFSEEFSWETQKSSAYNPEKVKKFFSTENQKLTLSQDDSMIAWVCGWIAQRLGIDSLWVRLAFLVGLFFFGMTFIIYLALWFLVPKEWTKQKTIHTNLATQKLTLSQDDSMIAWVCGWIAQRLGIDSLWVRLAFLVGLFFFGMTFIIYLALWFLIPNGSNQIKKNKKIKNLSVNNQEIKPNNFENIREKNYKNNSFFQNIFSMIKKIFHIISKVIKIWFKIVILAFILWLLVAVIAPTLFLSGLFFTDLEIYNQNLLSNVEAFLTLWVIGILFSVLFLIIGILWKIFQGKIIANFLMIFWVIGLFISIFISWIGFFQTSVFFTNTYSNIQTINLENTWDKKINIFPFSKWFENTQVTVNWIESIEFKQTQQENAFIEIESIINHKNKQLAQDYFETLTVSELKQENWEINIWVENIFNQSVSYQFLRKKITLYIPENTKLQLWNIPNWYLVNSIYRENNSYFSYSHFCENKEISFLEEKKLFTCK